MKAKFLKISLLSLIMAASLLTFTSCDKDDDPAPDDIASVKIVGTWEITSFKVDTSEYVGVIVDSSIVKYDSYTGDEGNFQQKVFYSDGEQDEISGKYRVDNKKREVTMIAAGTTEVVKVSFSANYDKMEWEGKDEELNATVKVKAKRR